MGNTYTQLYIQIVFGVLNRKPIIHPNWESNLHKYITATITQLGHKPLAINGMPDHIHLFLGLKPTVAISELIKSVKVSSTNFVNENRFCAGEKFAWQSGFGAFSYSKNDIDSVCKYISNQKEHHRKTTFEEEYKKMLIDWGISFEDKYLF